MQQESLRKQPEDKKCLRCGQCCQGCPKLKSVKGWCSFYRCSIWKKREKLRRKGKYMIISGHVCLPRELDVRLFPGCPLNQGLKT